MKTIYRKETPLIVKQYGERYKITVCKYDIWDIKDGNNSRNVNELKLDSNIKRARSKVYEYAACNEWEYFATLTLDAKKQNRYDLGEYIKDLGQFIRDERKRTGKSIKYLLIPEQHKNGAWHMHGYFSGIPSEDVTHNNNGYYHWQRYYERFGYCSLDHIKDKDKCDSYIVKYISKDLGGQAIGKNKKLYYASRGLNTATTLHRGYTSKRLTSPDWETDCVQILWCNSLEEALNYISILSD